MSEATKTCQVVFRTTPEVRQQLERLTEAEDRSLSSVIHRLLVFALQERNDLAHRGLTTKGGAGKGRRA